MKQQQLTTDLIHDLIVEPIPTLDICARHELSISDLLAILESDEFTHMLAQLQAADRLRIPIFRRRAINALESILLQQPTGSTHAETIRKAAALYLRCTTVSEPTPSDASEHSEPTHDPQTAHPKSQPRQPSPQMHQPLNPIQPPIPHPSTAPADLINAAGQTTEHPPPPTPSTRRSA